MLHTAARQLLLLPAHASAWRRVEGSAVKRAGSAGSARHPVSLPASHDAAAAAAHGIGGGGARPWWQTTRRRDLPPEFLEAKRLGLNHARSGKQTEKRRQRNEQKRCDVQY